MHWLGLTGGIASGKSSVSRIFRELGITVIDADVLARKAVEPGQPAWTQVVSEFGRDIQLPSGELDRKKLGALVFSDEKRRRRLEEIIHPRVREMMLAERERLRSAGAEIAVYDVPLLYEKNLASQFDAVIVVDCLEELQLARLMARDALSEDQARARLSAQMPLAEKRRLADYVIENNAGFDELRENVRRVLKKIISTKPS